MTQESAHDEDTSCKPSLRDPDAAKKRTHGFCVPCPPKQDPTDWSDCQFAKYGLPPKPNKCQQPALHDVWMATFGRELCFVKYERPTKPGPELHRLDVTPHDTTDTSPAVFSATRFETSRNWSGAYLEGNAGKTFRQIWGQWVVPTPCAPAGSPLSNMDGNNASKIVYQCSTWIGLDGQRLYDNSSLPQVGTAQQLTVNADGSQSVDVWAWTQWWARNEPDTLPVNIDCITVTPGDVISCVLTVRDNRQSVLCNMINNGKDCKDPPTVTAIEVCAPPMKCASGLRYSVSGATAEWVMERPAIPSDSQHAERSSPLRPFPDYGTMKFVLCYTELDGTGSVGQTLLNPRFIRMYEVRPNPQRTVYLSMPIRIDSTSFAVTYGDVWD